MTPTRCSRLRAATRLPVAGGRRPSSLSARGGSPSRDSQSRNSPRRGFALVAVLWVIVALGALSGASLVAARVGSKTSVNRILLTRATWAREACVDILRARFAADTMIRQVDTVDLGRGTWCAAELRDAGAKLNLNALDRPALVSLLAGRPLDSRESTTRVGKLADAILDWRDADDSARALGVEAPWYRARNRRPPRNASFADVAELVYVKGFDVPAVVELSRVLDVRHGRVNLNALSPRVIAGVSALRPAAARLLTEMRRAGGTFGSHEAVLRFLSERDVSLGADEFRRLVGETTLAPGGFVGLVVGGVRGSRLVSRVTLSIKPLDGRLAIIRRESE